MTKYFWVALAAVTLVSLGYLIMGIEIAPILIIGLGFTALISARIRKHRTA